MSAKPKKGKAPTPANPAVSRYNKQQTKIKTPRPGTTRKMELVPLVELCTGVVNSPSTNAMVI